MYHELFFEVLDDLGLVMPAIFLAVAIVVLILYSLFTTKGLDVVTIAGIILYSYVTWRMNDYFGIFFAVAALLTVLMSPREKAEYYILILFVLLGACLLVSSENFIMIVLSMEIISISSYVLVAGANPDKPRAEAAWKFFIFGSTATAVMIFGMSYIFGATGTLNLFQGDGAAYPTMITIGTLMMLSGLLFKMTAAPFHLWAPDVYQAAPAPVVAYLSVVPKLAAVFVIFQVSGQLGNPKMIAGFALASIIIGTLAALAQKEAKRMMAYSTVAHAGFLLIPVVSAPFSTLVFYAVVFLVMNYVVFMVIRVKENYGTTLYEDFSGMGYTAFIPALTITIALVSLTGLPPVAGFTAKLFIFTQLWQKFEFDRDPVFLALFVVGLLATVTSLFFYLKIPFYAFFRQPVQKETLKISPLTNLLLLFLVGILLLLFFFPSVLRWVGGVDY